MPRWVLIGVDVKMDLDTARKRLTEALKDRCQRYWDLMKSWYRRRVSGKKASPLSRPDKGGILYNFL